jgi:hypothetical protein
MAPVMPGLTDSAESIDAVARAASEHGALFFGASALRLMPTVKEHYMEFVADEFPALLGRYERAYPGVHAPREYTAALDRRVQRIRGRYSFYSDSARDPPQPHKLPPRVHARQLALPV